VGEYHPYEYCVLVKAGQDPKRFVREVRAELLEALKGLFEMIANPIADPNRVETVKQAQQAIAKAEGGE
jgi:hypothetical protein